MKSTYCNKKAIAKLRIFFLLLSIVLSLTYFYQVSVLAESSILQWSNIQSNTGWKNQISYFNTTWTDDLDANSFNFSFFELGFPNGTINNYTSWRFPNNISHFNLTLDVAGTYNWTMYANDSSNIWNKTYTTSFSTNSSCGDGYNPNLLRDNEIYTLTNDISSSNSCIIVGANNIIIDGNGKTLTHATSGFSSYGINIGAHSNITIKNLTIIGGNGNCDVGIGKCYNIYSLEGSNIMITNTSVQLVGTGADIYGIYLNGVNYVNILDNHLTGRDQQQGRGVGIYLTNSKFINVINNLFTRTIGSDLGSFRQAGLIISLNSTNITVSNNILEYTPNAFKLSDTLYNISITNNKFLNVVSSGTSNAIFDNNTITQGVDIGGGIIFVNGGISNSNGNDYNIRTANETSNFTNTGFTSSKKIFFQDAYQWFNYRNDSTSDIWLKSSVFTSDTLIRTLSNWNDILVR